MAYTFVLVHGSWHDNRAWKPVIDRLEQNGTGRSRRRSPVMRPMTGRTSRTPNAFSRWSISSKASDLRDFVLVGHSFGGTVIQAVTEQVPDLIRRLVFWNAFVLLDGQCLEDNVPPHYRDLFAQLAQPDGGLMLPYPVWRDAFIGDADETLARSAYETLSPTPRRSHTDKVSLPTFFSRQIPKSYLNCTEDIALPPGARLGLASAHVISSGTLSPRADAGQPRGDFHQSAFARGQACRGRTRLRGYNYT